MKNLDAILNRIQNALIAFNADDLETGIQDALSAGLTPNEIITQSMAAAMHEVGKKFERGEYFLPELVMAGRIMKRGVQFLKPYMLASGGEVKSKGIVVFGTVQGDLHDIGKNIVATMLEADGFQVIDLGVDQPPEAFVGATREAGADIVAMSALLTTTMPGMERVIRALAEAGLRNQVRVMVGGAPISQAFADRIGADGYAPDAVKAVSLARRLLAH